MASGTSAPEELRDEHRGAFKVHDRDGTASISAAEMRRTTRGEFTEVEVYEAFEGFDRDGLISAAELGKVARSMVRSADVDGDEQINYEEYARHHGA